MDRSKRCRWSRQQNSNLGLTSTVRDLNTKCSLDKLPGMHGAKTKRRTDYASQLLAKQKVRRMYGIKEHQFIQYFKRAIRMKKGLTGENLLKLLECRLDNVVYRIGFACTRAEARQLVSHKSVLVNQKINNIPSYSVKVGDVISIKEAAKNQLRIQAALTLAADQLACDWIVVDKTVLSGTFVRLPERNNLSLDIMEQLIVEYYSKH